MIYILAKKKSLIGMLIFIVVISTMFILFQSQKKEKFNDQLIKEVNANKNYTENERICLEFITNRMSAQYGGIYTNYLDASASGDLAGGHQVLSESEGIIMLYYIKINDKEAFDKHFKIITDKFLMDNGLIRWRVSQKVGESTNVSASIDDLRIIRSLIYASSKWNDTKYTNILKKVGDALLKNNIYNDMITNFYDLEANAIDTNINLSYVDLYTMDMLSKTENAKWQRIRTKGLGIISSGYISDRLPVYKKCYDLKDNKYHKDSKINMIDSLLVVLHLSEVQAQKKQSIAWIKRQINNGALYSEYDTLTGEKATSTESTAVYAIVASIAKNIQDDELYDMAIKKMLKLQNENKDSQIYGSFGDENTLEVFSFDNLQALLGF
ncbi:hypothetical protein LGK97_02320 [Clostridium sp. CS001]|uniref:glycosyl hydrolase family 8 n=1 Tax=Clostridium sp. CS001 TaxID=2880648 RepID=UPI001CF1273F|nr:glycosyl hydrolase family 8 [Clostridium sp. CS001]MCB2288598.1 hypothetical protein [Clostridium sp. CS001]